MHQKICITCFLKHGGTLFGYPHNEANNILGLILGSPYLGKLLHFYEAPIAPKPETVPYLSKDPTGPKKRK